jgi:hypothetical protein
MADQSDCPCLTTLFLSNIRAAVMERFEPDDTENDTLNVTFTSIMDNSSGSSGKSSHRSPGDHVTSHAAAG